MAMRDYELMYIVRPNVADDELASVTDKVDSMITNLGGSVSEKNPWGKRRLAYEIDKHAEGIYAVIKVTCPSAVVTELDRQLNLNESVLRTKITRPDAK